MRSLYNIIALLAIVMLGTACSMEVVEPGYTGIKVNLHGEDRGVSSTQIVTGRVYYFSWNTRIYEYPHFMQQFTWTRDQREGSPYDESITFNSKKGVNVNADIFVAFAMERDRIPEIFDNYRKPAEEITYPYRS